MKPWGPLANPGPGNRHRNANPSLNIRGSWPDADGYQQMLDELNAIRAAALLGESASDSRQVAKAIMTGRLIYAAAGGSANALTLALPVDPDFYASGQPFRVSYALGGNTGPCTINVNGLGVKPLVKRKGGALVAGDLQNGDWFDCCFDGSSVRIMNALPSEIPTPSTPPAQTLAALYAAEQVAQVFTAGQVLYDLPGVDTDYVAASVTIAGARYIDGRASCAWLNSQTTAVGFVSFLRLEGVGDAAYIGNISTQPNQLSQAVFGRWTGLNPATTYSLRLMVKKITPVGPIHVYDTRILATYGA